MKQTAVDYFIEQMIEYDFSPRDNTYLIEIPSWIFKEKIEKARAMMMEQIVDAYNNGDNRSADLYYTSTYGSQNITLQNESESKVITELSDEEIKPTHKVGKFIIEAIKEKIARTSQTEISDEEILEESNRIHGVSSIAFEEGAKWYREQLKNR